MIVSVVIPCYNSSQTIDEVVRTVRDELLRIADDYQIILVNDGSSDDVMTHIDVLCEGDSRVVGMELSRNYGQHNAILAGLSACCGDVVVGMDDDLQVSAADIGRLVGALDEECDLVYASFPSKMHSRFRNMGSRLFQATMRTLSDRTADVTTSSFWAAKRYLVDCIADAPIASPHLSSLFLSVTDKVRNVECSHRERASGKSGYTLSKLVRLWSTCIDYTTKPAELMIGAGGVLVAVGLVGLVVSLCLFAFRPSSESPLAALAFLVLLCSGAVVACCGVSVLYASRMFAATRPFARYAVRTSRNLPDDWGRGRQVRGIDAGSDGDR